MTPLFLSLQNAKISLDSPLARAFFSLVLGLILTVGSANWKANENQRVISEKFTVLAQKAKQEIQTRMQLYVYGLRGARGAALSAGIETLDRQHFLAYAQSRAINTEFPGVRGFGIVRRVLPSDEKAFVTTARARDWPEFQVRQIENHPGERYVIQYIEPVSANAAAVGLDLASENNRKSAADQAMRTGLPAMTAPITLIQAQGHLKSSFLLMLPIYRPGAAISTTEERTRAAQGWAYTPLVIEEAFATADLDRTDLALSLRDVGDSQSPPFYTQSEEEHLAEGIQKLEQFQLFGRTWEADFRPTLKFVRGLKLFDPSDVILIGAMLSLLLATLVHSLLQEALQRKQAQLERTRRSSMVQFSADAIIAEGLDGKVLDWNPAAEQLFGITAAHAKDRHLHDLILPPQRAHEDQDVIQSILDERCSQTFDTTRVNSKGELIDVAITAAPVLDMHGHIVGIVETIRDIREVKIAQVKIRTLNAELEQQVINRTQQLETARRDLQNILDAVPSMIGYWDKNLTNRVANRAYEKWFGIESGLLKGKHIRELLGEDIYQSNLSHIQAALTGTPQTFERDFPSPDGLSMRHSLAHYLPDIVEGEVQGFYVLVHDISELLEGRLKVASLQRDNEALLKIINTHTIVSVADNTGHIVEVNDTFCERFEYSRAELIGHMHHEKLESDQQGPDFWTSIWKTISHGSPWRGDICVRTKSGDLCWVNSIISPFIGGDGSVDKYISISFDITGAIKAEQALRASQSFLERAGEVAKLGAWQLDRKASKMTWSPQLKTIYEVPADFEPNLESGYDRCLPEYLPILQAAVQQCLADGTPWDLEVRVQTATGRKIWARVVGGAEFEYGEPVRLVGVLQDISERKEAELSLAYERHLMASLLNTVPDQIYFKNRDSQFLRINPGLAKRFGLEDPAQAIGKSDADFFSVAHAQVTRAQERSIMDTSTPIIDMEEQEVWLDKPPTWNLTTKMPLRDSEGEVIGTFGISRDITARKKIETQLLVSRQRFEMAADGAGLGVWEYDIVQKVLTWDARVFALFGVDPANAPDPLTIWEKSLHPEDRADYDLAVEGALVHGRPVDLEFRIIRPSGEVRYLRSAARVRRNELHQPIHLNGVNFDITEKKRAEQRLKETSTLLQNVLESASEVSIIATDPDLNIRVFNAGAQRLLGYSSAEMVGLQTPMAIHDAEEVRVRSEQLSQQVGSPIADGEVFIHASALRTPREWTYVHKDGRRIAVSLIVTAMLDMNGQLFGYLGIATDITAQKEVERSLHQAIHKAKQASQAKSQFLANMSHEIRTPMNAVIGLTYLLGHTTLDSEQEAFLEKIRLASQSLLVLINDVLDLSKIEANEMPIERVPVHIKRLLTDLTGVMAMQAESKKLHLITNVPTDAPEVVISDPTRLQQILTNLLSNAIKFTAEGQVSLDVRVVAAAPDHCRLHFAVKDTGIGIPKAAQARLFEPFVQEDSSTTRRFGGTGLGLSIVKHLVALMGGELGLNSEIGAGSQFWFELNFEVASDAESRHLNTSHTLALETGLHGIHLLVVDDNAINLEVAKRILQLQGAEISFAHHGKMAIDMLIAQPGAYDAVLMDIQMPEMDGLTATRVIRQQLGLTQLPIIALTAGAMLEEQQDAAAAGMNDFVPKPFDVKRLVSCIRRLLPQKPVPTESGSSTASAAIPIAWPSIEGVVKEDAFVRLGGDWNLFVDMLDLLLREYLAPSENPTRDEIPSPQSFKQRMHKLKGAAGTLGLSEVFRLAAEAEATDLIEHNTALDKAGHIERELRRICQSAEPYLAARSQTLRNALRAPATALIPEDLAELLTLLQQQNLDAMPKFEKLQAQLRQVLTDTAFEQLQGCMQALKFDEAAQLLRPLANG